jgi:hypothetical protein
MSPLVILHSEDNPQNIKGHSEPAHTSAPWRMNGKWSGNNFLLGSSSLANHGGYLSCILFYLPTNSQQAES